MKNILDETADLILDESLEQLYEMSNITTKESGLKTKLHVIQNGANRGLKHWARVKVLLPDGNKFPIEVNDNGDVQYVNKDGAYDALKNDNQKLVKEAMKYVKKIYKVIMAYWRGLFEEDDLHDILNGRKRLEDFTDNTN